MTNVLLDKHNAMIFKYYCKYNDHLNQALSYMIEKNEKCIELTSQSKVLNHSLLYDETDTQK